MTLASLLPLELRRRRLARAAEPGPLRRFLDTPGPTATSDCHDVEFLVLDFETTGVDPRRDEILSAGWVVIRRSAIELATASRRLVRPSQAIPEISAVIHAITDDEAAGGEALCAVLGDVLDALAGKVLVVHYAPAEAGFLAAACRRCFGGAVLTRTVDTLRLARRSLDRAGSVAQRGELRLGALRARYGLPDHEMHDALGDALATAELFLAQLAELGHEGRLPLRDILMPV